MIATQAPLAKVLRLMCLQSVTSGGITSPKFDLLRREVPAYPPTHPPPHPPARAGSAARHMRQLWRAHANFP